MKIFTQTQILENIKFPGGDSDTDGGGGTVGGGGGSGSNGGGDK
ncbi:hypothetical protein [Tenacibaculum jejuense]|nr:hypothetical protein [Tenacibaculum jejuense]